MVAGGVRAAAHVFMERDTNKSERRLSQDGYGKLVFWSTRKCRFDCKSRSPNPKSFGSIARHCSIGFLVGPKVSTVHVEGFSGLGRAPGSPGPVYGWQQWQPSCFHSGSPPIKALHVDDRPSILHRLPHR